MVIVQVYSLALLFPEPQSHVTPSQTPEAFRNQHILNLIFQHFDLQSGSQTVAQTRKDLFSAAKTCRAFVEPALNSLWRVLPSLLPLLLLLPSAEVNNGHYVRYILSCRYCVRYLPSIYYHFFKFVDELPFNPLNQHSACGWWRLDEHARRVRTLYMEPNNIVISPCIYLRIHTMRGTPLLPCLKKIYIPDNPSLDLSSVLFLASGSTLNTVQLDGNAISDRQFFVPFLSLLHIKSPGLSHLSLRGAVLNASMETIYHFSKLQSLEMRFRDRHLHPRLLYHLHKLGQLPHLLDLIIDTGDFFVTSIQRSTNPFSSLSTSNFRELKHLQILGTTTSMCYILNEMKGLKNLNALKIDEVWNDRSGNSTEISWKSSFEAISKFSAVEDIEITHDHNRPQDRYILSASSLDPLLKLDNLKSFVNYNIAFSGSDEDLLRLASGFPQLKKFVVPGPPPLLNGELGRTLACLYYLSQKCPDLREIKIAVSCSISDNLDAIKKLPHPIIRNDRHPLEKLYIDSDFGHQLQPIQLVQVARFLDLIFPNLSTLETDNSKMIEAANWSGIHELRLALKNARINPSSSDISDYHWWRAKHILLKDFPNYMITINKIHLKTFRDLFHVKD